MRRLGVVSFLNSKPLICGLSDQPDLECVLDVPARLPRLLEEGAVDVALIPIIDVIRSAGRWSVISDACIGCDGETMTVRVFSQQPPDRIDTLWVDSDSHTSVALSRVLWREIYQRDLDLRLVTPETNVNELPAVLLIGDKVVSPERGRFAYEVDLGGAWRQHTGLPFVFAVWACETERVADLAPTLAPLLCEARNRGTALAAHIAADQGPRAGWSVELAQRYLMRCLTYTLDSAAVAGANRFAELCAAADLAPTDAAINWPAALLAHFAERAP